jgi:hypothetical protein
MSGYSFTTGVRFPVTVGIFLFVTKFKPGLKPAPASYPEGFAGNFGRVKWTERLEPRI